MRLQQIVFFLLALVTTIQAFAVPDSFNAIAKSVKQLTKRRGGGGRGGGRSSSSHSSSSRTSSLTKPNSIKGGTTPAGSGPQPRVYNHGHTYYPGGAAIPYRAGAASPDGIKPTFIPAAGLRFYPGVWLYGAYAYPYHGYYLYHNDTSKQNETSKVECLCARFYECGCDANNQTDYVTDIANNHSQSRVTQIKGQQTLVINGTLPNGTTAASAAPAFRQGLAGIVGWSVVISGVAYTVWFM